MTHLTKPLSRRSAARASTYGKDAARPLVVTLIPGPGGDDLIQLHPLRCPSRKYVVTVADLWSYLQKCAANKRWSEKMAARKAAKADQRERARLLRSVHSK